MSAYPTLEQQLSQLHTASAALLGKLLLPGYTKDRGRDEALSPFSPTYTGQSGLKLGVSEINRAPQLGGRGLNRVPGHS
jgi:hypothetical protein